MSARSKARKRALDILFEAELRSLDPAEVLATREQFPGREAPLPSYAIELVEGVIAHRERIDEILATYAQGWTIERMPVIDRNVLRLGVWEILYNDDVPDPVAVDEAGDLVRTLSTDDSPGFVSGILGRVIDLKPGLLA